MAEPNPSTLPTGLESYKRTALFTADTVPAGLRGDHSTKAGTWGLIHVEQGRLHFRITDPRRAPHEAILTPDCARGVVEPTILHHVEPLGTVCFHVEFFRQAAG